MISENACRGIFSCRGSGIQGMFYVNAGSCVGDNSCFGSVGSTSISNSSCQGTSSCSYLSGVNIISNESCKGMNSCTGLYSSIIGSESCIGQGTCSRCTSFETCTITLAGSITVGQRSCLGCYTCRQISGTTSIGNDSCLHSNACEKSSGTRSIADYACQGFKACSNSSDTVIINSDTCNYSKACMSLSGYSVITHSPTSSPSLRSALSCYPNARKIKIQSTTGQQIQVFEVEAISSGVNVAAFKAARSSTTLKQFNASNAIDNNPTTFSHTNDRSAWLEIDLKHAAAIESVNITNRFCGNIGDASGCLCRLTNATVSLLDELSVVITEKVLGNTCGVLGVANSFESAPKFCKTNVPTSSPNKLHAACYPKAKKLKLQSTTGEYIQVFEVKVISSGVNVAKDGHATQSSTFKPFNASNAVDNKPSTFSHTNDTSAWLMVDFRAFFDVESVNISNRFCNGASDPPGCLCRLTNSTMSLLDENNLTVTSVTLGNTCGQHILETLFDPSPFFCANEAQLNQRRRLPWAQRNLGKRPSKC
ncbi:hypothetical protein ACHAWO_010948 [Cyclotella atomus]|uniref:DUF7640 domain-containing protein n=1 Tax=Cyclotella atomus TaxID=382360 RepID=A0ABD3Q1F5_9STRA